MATFYVITTRHDVQISETPAFDGWVELNSSQAKDLVHALRTGQVARSGYAKDGFTAEISDDCLYLERAGEQVGIDVDEIPALIAAIEAAP